MKLKGAMKRKVSSNDEVIDIKPTTSTPKPIPTKVNKSEPKVATEKNQIKQQPQQQNNNNNNKINNKPVTPKSKDQVINNKPVSKIVNNSNKDKKVQQPTTSTTSTKTNNTATATTSTTTTTTSTKPQQPQQSNKKREWQKIDIDSDQYNVFSASGLVGLEVIDDLQTIEESNVMEAIGYKKARRGDNDEDDDEFTKKYKEEKKKDPRDKSLTHEESKRRKEFEKFKQEARKERERKRKELQLQDTIAEEEANKLDMCVWESYNLDPLIVKGLRSLGYEQPTEIQSQVIPLALQSGYDIIGAAETGSGKTLAFGIPMLNTILKHLRANGEDVVRNKLPQVGLVKKDNSHKKLLSLILCPTRELAIQVTNHLRSVSQETSVRVVSVVGGMALPKQERELSLKPEIVVGTPGRLWELIESGDQYLGDLSHLLCFGVDEADRMVEKGHFKEVDNILARLPKFQSKGKKQQEQEKDDNDEEQEEEELEEMDEQDIKGMEEIDMDDIEDINGGDEMDDDDDDEEDEMVELEGEDIQDINGEEIFDFEEGKTKLELDPDTFVSKEDEGERFTSIKRQTFVFSATIVGLHEDQQTKKKKNKANTPLEELITKVQFHRKFKLVDCTLKKLTAQALKESKILCNLDEKDDYLYYFIDRYPGKTLVFVNSIDCIRRVQSILTLLRVPVYPLHAQMEQRQRLRNLDHFKRQKRVVLIATDVAARGLDIPNVEHVIHYQCPRTLELYIHRSGRTARSNRDGISVVIVGPKEQRPFAKLESGLDHHIEDFPVDLKYMPGIRERIGLALEIDSQSHEKRKVKNEKNWYIKSARAIDMELDEEFFQSDSEEERDNQIKEQMKLNKLKMTLQHLLGQPIAPKGLSKKYHAMEEYDTKTNANATTDLIKSRSKKKW